MCGGIISYKPSYIVAYYLYWYHFLSPLLEYCYLVINSFQLITTQDTYIMLTGTDIRYIYISSVLLSIRFPIDHCFVSFLLFSSLTWWLIVISRGCGREGQMDATYNWVDSGFGQLSQIYGTKVIVLCMGLTDIPHRVPNILILLNQLLQGQFLINCG